LGNVKLKIFGLKLFEKSTAMSDVNFYELLRSAIGGFVTAKSGVNVDVKSALQVSVVLSCLRVLSEGCAQVPCRIMQESEDGRTRLPAKKHDLYRLLNKKPNRWQSSFELRESMIFNAALLGNAYVFKNKVGVRGKIKELIFIETSRVRHEILPNNENLFHITGRNGEYVTLTDNEIWHFKGPSFDGRIGLNILNLAREAVGLAISAEETQSDLHKNGVKSTGFYSIDGTLNAEQYKSLSEWVIKQSASTAAPMVLDRAAKWVNRTMTGVDAQHLETRKHQTEEICRSFRIMPIMVGQSDKAATYASAEQMFIAHLVHTLTPWYERFEQSIDCQLLTDDELDQGYYAFLDPTGMLRGALKDTAEYLYKNVSIGNMTRNEAREKLDLNPIEGLDTPITPMNLTTQLNQEVTA
jgi:HK97 family phage portal protein